MGGINCPPGGGGISDEFMSEYIAELASYSKSLFGASANFYAANVAIEEAVLSNGDVVCAVQLLDSCMRALSDAVSTLGTVASLWSSVRSPEVDFGEQQQMISEARGLVEVACLELQGMDVRDSLQGSLWRDPALTQAFVGALKALSEATEWQATFAQAPAPANLIAR